LTYVGCNYARRRLIANGRFSREFTPVDVSNNRRVFPQPASNTRSDLRHTANRFRSLILQLFEIDDQTNGGCRTKIESLAVRRAVSILKIVRKRIPKDEQNIVKILSNFGNDFRSKRDTNND